MSDISRFGDDLGEFVRGVLRGVTAFQPPTAAPRGPALDEFPPAGIDVVHHALRVRLDVGATGTGDETVLLQGKMLVDRSDPYRNGDGVRQIDFHVRSWEAAGWSWTMKESLTYVLAENVEQPTSTIVAEQADSDYPAKFTFNVIFDVRSNNQVVFQRHHGTPEAPGFKTVPPSGEREFSPRITTFETTRVQVEHPDLGMVEAIPIDCNDLGSLTVATF